MAEKRGGVRSSNAPGSRGPGGGPGGRRSFGGGPGGRRAGGRRGGRYAEEGGLYEKVVRINRISKTVAGGRRLRFSALVIVGDRKGKVGVGLSKSHEVPMAIDKARRQAQRSMFTIPIEEHTIPNEVLVKFKAAKILLRPAQRGRGIVACQTLRAIAEAAGINDLVTKVIGRSNPVNISKAMMKAFGE